MKVRKIIIAISLLFITGTSFIYFVFPEMLQQADFVVSAQNNSTNLDSKTNYERHPGKTLKEKTKNKIKDRNLEELLFREELLIREVNKMSHSFDRELFNFLSTRFDRMSERSQGAFLARIGRYDKKSVNRFLIKQAKGHRHPKVQRRAINALSQKENPEREQALRKLYLNKKDLEPETVIVTIGSYYRILKDTKLLNSLEKDLINFIKSAMKSNDESFLYVALMELSKIDPENAQMFNLGLDYLKQRGEFESPELTNYMIKLLSRYRPKQIEKSYMSFFNNGDVKLKIELLNSLSMICPQNILDLVDKILSSSQNSRVHLALIRNMIFFPPEKTIPFLEKNRELLKVDGQKWDQYLLKVKDSELGNTCETVTTEDNK